MNHVLDHLATAFGDAPANSERLLDALSGKVTYGVFQKDPTIAIRKNEDGTEAYGRFNSESEFVPFTETEHETFIRTWMTDTLPFIGSRSS